MALTNTSFRKAKATGKDYSLNGLDGLLLFVGIKGAKKWHFRFLWMGKQFCVALGAYPEISLKEARALRDELRVQVAKGVDPHAYRSQAQEAASAAATNTLQAVFTLWRSFKALSLKTGRQSTLSQIDRIFAKECCRGSVNCRSSRFCASTWWKCCARLSAATP